MGREADRADHASAAERARGRTDDAPGIAARVAIPSSPERAGDAVAFLRRIGGWCLGRSPPFRASRSAARSGSRRAPRSRRNCSCTNCGTSTSLNQIARFRFATLGAAFVTAICGIRTRRMLGRTPRAEQPAFLPTCRGSPWSNTPPRRSSRSSASSSSRSACTRRRPASCRASSTTWRSPRR